MNRPWKKKYKNILLVRARVEAECTGMVFWWYLTLRIELVIVENEKMLGQNTTR